MENLLEYKVIVDNSEESNLIFSDDIKFFLEEKLIEQKGENSIVKFVGEVITPHCKYISLPKLFNITENNVRLIKKVINKYKTLKYENKILITNVSYAADKEAEIKSDAFYFNKLKEYFLDYITYEFIYPKKKLIKHSKTPLKGKIDVLKTEREFERKGGGVTYKIKDIKNSLNWGLDDIYYTTILKLSNSYGSDKDIEQINNMIDFIKSEGYDIKIDERILQDDPPTENIIKDIKRCEVDGIHNPIKNTLIRYFESEKIKEKNTIFAFYTKQFEYVWEFFSRKVLYNDEKFKKEFFEKFTDVPRSFKKGGFIIEREERPDIFSNYRNMKFIGDSKYYKNLDSDFRKEQYEYNTLCDNQYPMCVFVPNSETEYEDIRINKEFELVIISLSLEEVILDVINETDIVINKVQEIIKEQSERYKFLKEEENYYIEIMALPSGEIIEIDEYQFELIKKYLKFNDKYDKWVFSDKDYHFIKDLLE